MASCRLDTVVLITLTLLTECHFIIAGNKYRESGGWGKLDGSHYPSYLPTTLLKDKGRTESRLPEPLLQTAMTYYQTRPETIDNAMLMVTLGNHFDAKWMSVQRPTEGVDNVEIVHDYDRIDPVLVSDLRKLNFTYLDGKEGLVTMKHSMQKALEKWLLQKASCPVQYQWTDIGPLYWPRWIRIGMCSGESHCSWPPGMMCVASKRPMTIRVLRWHCRPRRRNKQTKNRNRNQKSKPNDRLFRVKCRWRKVRYPITTACACTC